MADSDTFDVVVIGFEPAEDSPAVRLERVFGIETATAERLLARLPAPVQKRVPRVRAEYFRRALIKIGGAVEVRDEHGECVDALEAPVSAPPAPRPSQAPAARAEQPMSASWNAGEDGEQWSTVELAPHLVPAPPLTATARLEPAFGGTADTMVDQRVRPAAASANQDTTTSPDPSSAARALGALDAASPDTPLSFPLPVGGPAQWPVLASPDIPTVIDPEPPRHEPGPEALRAPAHPTWLEGKPLAAPAPLRPASDLAAKPHQASPAPAYAAASALADARPALASEAAWGGFRSAAPPSGARAEPGFRPPALELGISDSGEHPSVMSRMPSSVWDAMPDPAAVSAPAPAPAPAFGPAGGLLDLPPVAGPIAGVPSAAGAGRRAPRELSQPRHGGNEHLTLDPVLGAQDLVLPKWEHDDSMTEPVDRPSLRSPRLSRPGPPGSRASGAPVSALTLATPAAAPALGTAVPGASNRPSVAPLDLPIPAPAGERGVPRQPGARGDRPRRPRKSAAGARGDKDKPKRVEGPPPDTRTFWQALPDACALPLSGPGGRWVGVIAVWALVVAVLSFVAFVVPPLGAAIAFFGYGSLLAVACDYFRACFWVPSVGGDRLDRAPVLSAARIFHAYVKSGVHVSLFALTVGLPLIIWLIQALGQGATPVELMSEPATWLLALPAGLLWPASITLTALSNNLSAVWNVPQAVAALRRAQREYLLVVAVGAVTFGMGMWAVLFVGDAMGLTGVLLTATFGLPLALSHGLMGALMGHLTRARPEAFG